MQRVIKLLDKLCDEHGGKRSSSKTSNSKYYEIYNKIIRVSDHLPPLAQYDELDLIICKSINDSSYMMKLKGEGKVLVLKNGDIKGALNLFILLGDSTRRVVGVLQEVIQEKCDIIETLQSELAHALRDINDLRMKVSPNSEKVEEVIIETTPITTFDPLKVLYYGYYTDAQQAAIFRKVSQIFKVTKEKYIDKKEKVIRLDLMAPYQVKILKDLTKSWRKN